MTSVSVEQDELVREKGSRESYPSGIYVIHSPCGRVYVGQSTNIRGRISSHRGKLRNGLHPNSILQSIWTASGGVGFEFVIVESAPVLELNAREDYWTQRYNAFDPEYGFNVLPVPNKGRGTSSSVSKDGASKNGTSVSVAFRRATYDLILASPGLPIDAISKKMARGPTATGSAIAWLQGKGAVDVRVDFTDRRKRGYWVIAPFPLSDAEKLVKIRSLVDDAWSAEDCCLIDLITSIKEILNGD
jgi:hypothetical protein